MLALLRRMKQNGATVHGFRSCFRDWCAEATNCQREVAEAALGHTLGNKVEAAYQRADLFAKRRGLMRVWAAFCIPPTATTDEPVVTKHGPSRIDRDHHRSLS
jgi:integrase